MNARVRIWSSLILCGSLSIAAAQTAPVQRATPRTDADANAYRAFAVGNQKELARWQAAGGDAARYARENPEAIYDAMGAERDVDILEFVLKSGANPNVPRNPNGKGGPIFANVGDRDKIALLIQYGAEVNTRDYSGYAPLSHVLFAGSHEFKLPAYPRAGQKVRVFSKVGVVRLLVDNGAEINGDLGGWGHSGALGLARREDKDVIDLLIERGATLKDLRRGPILSTSKQTGERGPLTLALEMDRDDLALALLRRDKRIASTDNLALLEAARRGYSELALAIVNAGADPNVADAQGDTSLAWAQRRKDAVLAAALQDAGAEASVKTVKPRLNFQARDAFERDVAKAIDEAFDPDQLTRFNSEVAFAFYGDDLGKLEAVKCERSVGLTFIGYWSVQGRLSVGICKDDVGRVRKLALGAKASLAQVMMALAQSVPKPEQLSLLGWEWRHASQEGGVESYSFPIVVIGHGIGAVNTVVVVNGASDRAVIVQGELAPFCEPSRKIRTPLLCSEPLKILDDLALRVNDFAARE